MPVCGKMVQMNPCRTGTETRRRGWTCGHSGEGEGGAKLGEEHRHIHTTVGQRELVGAAVYRRELSCKPG